MSYPKSVYGAAEQLETEMTEVLRTMLSKYAINLTDMDLNTQVGKVVVATGKDRSTMTGRVQIYYIQNT